MLKLSQWIKHFLFTNFLFLSLLGSASAVTVGEPAPNIFGRTLDEKLFRLSDIQHPVVVNFFWVECKPCVQEMPELAKLEKAYPDIQIISMHVSKKIKR